VLAQDDRRWGNCLLFDNYSAKDAARFAQNRTEQAAALNAAPMGMSARAHGLRVLL